MHKADMTGRDRLAWNVIASWGGHLVFVVAGFVMPRMIDGALGQVSLGVWDFCWSLVNYFSLAGLGVGSSVNRHVAIYRSSGQIEKLRSAVTSVIAIQLGISVFVLLLTAAAVSAVRTFFAGQLADHTAEAAWVVALLGISLAVQMGFDAFRGIITGCHRWDLHNGINASAYALTVLGMILELRSGGGLRGLSAIYLSAVVLTEMSRILIARRVCPEFRLDLSLANRDDAREMFLFGVKRIVAALPPLILNQSVSVLILTFLGPARLAVYARPAGLMRSAQTFIDKFAFVTTPTAASLQGSGRADELRAFLIRSTQFAVAIAAPICLLLAIQGKAILALWMGGHYSGGAVVLALLAGGMFLPMTQQPTMNILIGMNRHGRLGAFTVGVSVAGLAVGVAAASAFGLSIRGAALITALPLLLANGIVLPLYACKQLQLSPWTYAARSYAQPLLFCLPFAVVLIATRTAFSERYLVSLAASLVAGAIALLPLAWSVMPERMRQRLFRGKASGATAGNF